MYSFNDTSVLIFPSHDCGPAIPVLRSYRQIAATLTRTEQEPISPAQVRRLCRRAEARLAKALLSDSRTALRLLSNH